MNFSKEIAAMRKRAIKVSRITTPPTLTMPVYLQWEEVAESSLWSLPVMIEQRRAFYLWNETGENPRQQMLKQAPNIYEAHEQHPPIINYNN